MENTFDFCYGCWLDFAVSAITTYAADGVAMTVNGTEYTDHGTDWSEAVKLADNGTEVKVKLFADWVADADTGFVCTDGGTLNGAVFVGKGVFTLDLNGYTLDRNAPGDKVMLWYNPIVPKPVCNALALK